MRRTVRTSINKIVCVIFLPRHYQVIYLNQRSPRQLQRQHQEILHWFLFLFVTFLPIPPCYTAAACKSDPCDVSHTSHAAAQERKYPQPSQVWLESAI